MVDYGDVQLNRLNPDGNIEQRQSPRKAREVEIFAQIGRHLLAILYLLAELRLGYKPEKFNIKE